MIAGTAADPTGGATHYYATTIPKAPVWAARVKQTLKIGLLVMPRQGGETASGRAFGAITLTRSDLSRWQFSLGDRNSHNVVATKHQNKKDGKLAVITVNNDDAPAGLPAVHTDRHIYPNKTAAESAAKARLAAFNRSTADVRLEVPGRTDLFAERPINAQGFKVGLDGECLADSVERVYTQAGWSTTDG